MTSVLKSPRRGRDPGTRRRRPRARGNGSTGRSPASMRGAAPRSATARGTSRVLRRPPGREVRLRSASSFCRRAEAVVGVAARRAARWRTTRRGAGAPTGDTGRARRRRPAPRPSRARASADPRGCSASDSRVDRSASVSSMRRMNVPSVAVRQQPVEQRRAGVADVQLAGGAGAKLTRMHGSRLIDQHSRSSATACAAIASPRPTASTPSLVLPFTLTARRRCPSAPASRARICVDEAARSSAARATTITSTFTTAKPAPRDDAGRIAAAASMLEASFHCGSVSG